MVQRNKKEKTEEENWEEMEPGKNRFDLVRNHTVRRRKLCDMKMDEEEEIDRRGDESDDEELSDEIEEKPNETEEHGVLSRLLTLGKRKKDKKKPLLPLTNPNDTPVKTIINNNRHSYSSLTELVASPQTLLDFYQNKNSLTLPNTSTLSFDSSNDTSINDKAILNEIQDLLEKQDFMILLAKSFNHYGLPSLKLERKMNKMAKFLSLSCSSLFLPGLMIVVFGDTDTHTSETHIVKVTQGNNMYKLRKVTELHKKVLNNQLKICDATKELTAIIKEPNPYPWYFQILAYGIMSFAVCPLAFQGGWLDACLSGSLGLVIGSLNYLATQHRVFANILEIVVSVLCGFVAAAFSRILCYQSVLLASAIKILPGLPLTRSFMELASKNHIAGAVRLLHSLMISFTIGFGFVIGGNLWRTFDDEFFFESEDSCSPASKWWWFLLLPVTSIGLNITLHASPKQWLPMVLVASTGFTINYFATKISPRNLFTPAVAGFGIGLATNIYYRITKQNPYIPLTGGIILLMPGGIGVRGAQALFNNEKEQGTSFALAMISINLAIALGILTSTLFPTSFRLHRISRQFY